MALHGRRKFALVESGRPPPAGWKDLLVDSPRIVIVYKKQRVVGVEAPCENVAAMGTKSI